MEKFARSVRAMWMCTFVLLVACVFVNDVNGIRPHPLRLGPPGPTFIGPKYPFGRYHHRSPKVLFPKAYIELRYPLLHAAPKDKHPPPPPIHVHSVEIIDGPPPHGDVHHPHPLDYTEYIEHIPPGPPPPPPSTTIIKETGPPGPIEHVYSSPPVVSKIHVDLTHSGDGPAHSGPPHSGDHTIVIDHSHPGDHPHSGGGYSHIEHSETLHSSGPPPDHFSSPPQGPPPSTIIQTGSAGPINHVSSSPVVTTDHVVDLPEKHHSNSEYSGPVLHIEHAPPDLEHAPPHIEHAPPEEYSRPADHSHSGEYSRPADHSHSEYIHPANNILRRPSGPPPTILTETGPDGPINHVSSSPVVSSTPVVDVDKIAPVFPGGITEDRYAYNHHHHHGSRESVIEKIRSSPIKEVSINHHAHPRVSHPRDSHVEIAQEIPVHEGKVLDATPVDAHDLYYSPSQSHSHRHTIDKKLTVPKNIQERLKNKRPLSSLDLGESVHHPNAIDISFHSDPVAAPLVENIPAGPKDVYEPPKEIPIQPIEKIIRNTHLDEFIWVRREEGTPNIRLTLSSGSKSTFYIDDVHEGRKIHVVSKEGVCIQGVPYDGRKASAIQCSNDDPLLRWTFVPIQHGQYWIQQKESNFCLQPSDTLTTPRFVEMKPCDLYEHSQLWEIGSVYPIQETLKEEAFY